MTKWVTKMLGDLVVPTKGRLTSQSDYYIEDWLPLINTTAIDGEPNLWADPTNGILCNTNDVLMLWDGERSGLVITNKEGVVGSTFARFRPQKEIDGTYIYYYLLNRFDWIQSRRTGTGVPHAPKDLMRILDITYPESLTEQRRIAGILSSADGAIAASEALIAKYRNIKRGLLTTLLQPKEGWKKVKFDDFFDFIPTNTLSRDKLNDQYGTYQNIHYGDVLIKYPFCLDCNSNEIPFINEDVNFNKAEIKDGDVVFADTAEDDTVGKCVEILNVGEKKIVAGLHTYLCRPKYKMALGYLGYFLNSDTFHDQLLRYIAGSKVSSVNKTSIKNTYIYYPEDLAEQRRIADILSSVDAKIAAEEKVVEKYKGVKKGLMEEMMKEK